MDYQPLSSNYQFIQLNKMSTLFEDQASRAQRYRKHQLYKNMLDEQIKFKNQYRESQASAPRFTSPKSNTYEQYQNYYTPKNFQQPYPRQSYPRNIQNSPNTRFHTQPEQQTEKYLDSCEQIIKNLRELKQKRKQRQLTLFKIENNPKPAAEPKKEIPVQVYQYPKARNSQFSASLYKSRQPFRQQSVKKRQKPQLKPLKTLQPSSKPSLDERRKSMRVTPTNKKVKKIEVKEKIQEQQEEKDKEIQSSQPRGIKDNNHNSQKNKNSRKKISKQNSKQKAMSKSKERQTSQSKKSLNLQQKEVYDCLLQLMKYFRAKNEKLQEQRKKGELVNEEVQVDPIEDQEQSNQKKREHNVSELKLKALIKLRQLNQKSRQFVAKVKGVKEEDDKNKSLNKKSPSKKDQDENTQQFTNESNPKEQLRLKSRLGQQLKKKKEQQQQISRTKEQKQNQQLFKAIANQLNKQQQQNQSLTNCLRELSQYLKDHKEQMQAMKSSRIQKIQAYDQLTQKNQSRIKSRSKSKNSEAPNTAQNYRAQQFPKAKQSLLLSSNIKKQDQKQKAKIQHTKQQQNILKQAFLKRLKKARLRGKLLNEKVENYKKQHHNQKQQKQQPEQLQINPQLSPDQLKQSQQKPQEVVNVQ